MTVSPTERFKGSALGPTLSVLSRPEIRRAEVIGHDERFDTLDGFVNGRGDSGDAPADVVITAYCRERYPIRRAIFLGTYQVLGRVGRDMLAERLIHPRRAWEVLEDGASFDYGPGRGVVGVKRGSWLYQSDDDDFGTVHPEVKHAGHLLVGPEEDEVTATDWARRSAVWSTALGALPPLLALLALGAFVAAPHPGQAPDGLSGFLIGTEVTLLVSGAALVWTMRRKRWFLRACVQTARTLGLEFEAAVVLLGHTASERFPGMPLWRAAQSVPDPGSPRRPDEAALQDSLHRALTQRMTRLEHDLHRTHRREKVAEGITLGAFALVLVVNIFLLLGPHLVALEVTVIWIPVLVSAIHGFDLRRRTAERVAAMRELHDRLRFAQQGLFAAGPNPGPERDALLRMVCAAAAQYGQRELKLALASEASVPI
ncbi:MAG: hypothetical protein ABTR92_12620 [Candidatus Accumulibacter phosphatis]